MLFTTLLRTFAFVFVLPAASATNVTLYRIGGQPPSSATLTRVGYSVTIKPIAVETNGQTVYVAEEAESLVVYRDPRMTATLLATPTTNTWTFRADASRYHHIQTQPTGQTSSEEDCKTRKDGKMVCKVKLVAEAAHTTIRFKTTATGVPSAWYTITGVENLSLPTVTVASAALGLVPDKVVAALVVCAVSVLGAGVGGLL